MNHNERRCPLFSRSHGESVLGQVRVATRPAAEGKLCVPESWRSRRQLSPAWRSSQPGLRLHRDTSRLSVMRPQSASVSNRLSNCQRTMRLGRELLHASPEAGRSLARAIRMRLVSRAQIGWRSAARYSTQGRFRFNNGSMRYVWPIGSSVPITHPSQIKEAIVPRGDAMTLRTERTVG